MPTRLGSSNAAAVTQWSHRGYHILLEKPMAVTPEDCKAIVEAIERNGVLFSVG